MVQISGNYKLERDENYIEFLEAVGLPKDVVNEAAAAEFTMQILVDGDTYSMIDGDGNNITFTLYKEFEEILPIKIKVNSVPKLEGNKLVIASKSSDGRVGGRSYEFTENGYILCLPFQDITAKRYYSRV